MSEESQWYANQEETETMAKEYREGFRALKILHKSLQVHAEELEKELADKSKAKEACEEDYTYLHKRNRQNVDFGLAAHADRIAAQQQVKTLREALEKIAVNDGGRWKNRMQEIASAALATTPSIEETEIDSNGVKRYKKKPIMRWLGDVVDLNDMWVAFQEGVFTESDFKQFYRDIGYSLDGFEDVWAEISQQPATETPGCLTCGSAEYQHVTQFSLGHPFLRKAVFDGSSPLEEEMHATETEDECPGANNPNLKGRHFFVLMASPPVSKIEIVRCINCGVDKDTGGSGELDLGAMALMEPGE